jgi:4-hydroxyphenylacetate 3-monooxygenase
MQQRSSFRDVQIALGELLGLRHNIWALSTAMAADAQPGPGGYLLPNTGYAMQWRNVYGDMFTRARTIFQNILSGNLIQIPSSAEDFKNPAIRPLLDRYWKGGTATAEERVKLLRVIWDVFFTEFAGRTEAHERNFAGGYDANRVETYMAAEHQGLNADCKAMVDECMSHYDLNGWTDPTWAEVPWSIPEE